MKIIITLLLLVFVSTTNAQISIVDGKIVLENISFYKTTDDFINNNPTALDKVVVLRNKIKDDVNLDSISAKILVISAKKIIEKETSKKFSEGQRSWALKYNNNFFFNLGYSSDVNSWGNWVKIDIVGKYCLIIINPKSSLVRQIGSNNGGLGLEGLLNKESVKWGKNFVNNKNENIKMIFIDTENQSDPFMSRYKGSIGDLLTRKDLKKLSKKHNIDFDEENATFENVIDFIEQLNSK